MGYTPKFQAILDHCTTLATAGSDQAAISQYFIEAVRALGLFERLNNLYRIRPKRPLPGERSRYQFFRMKEIQEQFFLNRTNRDLVLKSRQVGITTLSCLIALDKAIWEFGTHSAIMAHVRENVKKFFRISKLAFKHFQKDWGHLYPVNEKTDNVNELEIKETGSSMMVCTETKGLTLDFLHISEAAFVDDERISESLESVPMSGWVVMETTPDTAAGMFYDLWSANYRGEFCSFKAHFLPWWLQYPEEEDLELPQFKTIPTNFKFTDKEELLVREHGLTKEHIVWRRIKISEVGGDEGEFCRKYPEDPLTCFLSGSNSVFPIEALAALWKSERAPSYVGDLLIAA